MKKKKKGKKATDIDAIVKLCSRNNNLILTAKNEIFTKICIVVSEMIELYFD